MARKHSGNRILGPYRDKKQGHWFYGEVVDGKRSWFRIPGCTDEEEAREFVEGVKDRFYAPPPMTVQAAVEEYVKHIHRQSGNAETEAFAKCALKPLVKARGDHLAANLSANALAAFLRDIEGRAMATRRSYWKCLMRFMAWLRKRGVLHKDVAADYLRQRDRMDEPLPWRTRAGARELGRGKAQLRNQSEVEAYLATALALTHPITTPKAMREQLAAERRVAATLPLLCGLASGEVLHLKVGDVDLEAGIGYVRDGGAAEADGWHVKTAARNGEWEIPQVLRADLTWLTEGRAPDAFLLHDDCNKPHTRGWLRDLVVEVCAKASVEGQPVRKVCPHGLRGTHATLLRVLLGRGIGDIADALRHGDEGRTATRHYVGAPERRQALRVIVGGIDEAKGSSGRTDPDAGRISSRISSRGAEQVGIGG